MMLSRQRKSTRGAVTRKPASSSPACLSPRRTRSSTSGPTLRKRVKPEAAPMPKQVGKKRKGKKISGGGMKGSAAKKGTLKKGATKKVTGAPQARILYLRVRKPVIKTKGGRETVRESLRRRPQTVVPRPRREMGAKISVEERKKCEKAITAAARKHFAAKRGEIKKTGTPKRRNLKTSEDHRRAVAGRRVLSRKVKKEETKPPLIPSQRLRPEKVGKRVTPSTKGAPVSSRLRSLNGSSAVMRR